MAHVAQIHTGIVILLGDHDRKAHRHYHAPLVRGKGELRRQQVGIAPVRGLDDVRKSMPHLVAQALTRAAGAEGIGLQVNVGSVNQLQGFSGFCGQATLHSPGGAPLDAAFALGS